jgi:nucleoside-diphosphate-sugar epimerase
MALRFAPTVHGKGDNGFTAMIVAADRAAGQGAYVGEGTNRWAAVHRSDVARLVRLAIERAPAGSVLHGVSEEGVALRDLADAISRRYRLQLTAISPEEATARFGFLAPIVALDMPASSAITRDLLGWQPTGPTLIEDIETSAYSNGSHG